MAKSVFSNNFLRAFLAPFVYLFVFVSLAFVVYYLWGNPYYYLRVIFYGASLSSFHISLIVSVLSIPLSVTLYLRKHFLWLLLTPIITFISFTIGEIGVTGYGTGVAAIIYSPLLFVFALILGLIFKKVLALENKIFRKVLLIVPILVLILLLGIIYFQLEDCEGKSKPAGCYEYLAYKYPDSENSGPKNCERGSAYNLATCFSDVFNRLEEIGKLNRDLCSNVDSSCCKLILAGKVGDKSLCEEIPVIDRGSSSAMLNCYLNVAIVTENKSVIDNIPGIAQPLDYWNGIQLNFWHKQYDEYFNPDYERAEKYQIRPGVRIEIPPRCWG